GPTPRRSALPTAGQPATSEQSSWRGWAYFETTEYTEPTEKTIMDTFRVFRTFRGDYLILPPMPNWSPARTGPSPITISTIFSLWTSRPFSSCKAVRIFLVLVSITSPVDG